MRKTTIDKQFRSRDVTAVVGREKDHGLGDLVSCAELAERNTAGKPFAGIAFLWFIGVLRDRLGELEDRFFATVFLGSGLLFLAMLFASAAVGGGIIIAYSARREGLLDSATFTFARAVTYEIMNLYAVKVAAVFMISTSTLSVGTAFTPRWIAFLGFACALVLLLSGRHIDWILLVFPVWVLLISIYILIDNLRRLA